MSFLTKNFRWEDTTISNEFPELAEKIVLTDFDKLALKYLFVYAVESIYNKFGELKRSSVKRSKSLNEKIKGHKYSDHLHGIAIDFRSIIHNNFIVFEWIIKESKIYYRQLIYYPEYDFIHLSVNIHLKKEKHEALVYINKEYFTYEEYKKILKKECKYNMDKLKSRKLWVAIISALLIVANDGLGINLPKESIMTVAGIIITYILGQSIIDSKK